LVSNAFKTKEVDMRLYKVFSTLLILLFAGLLLANTALYAEKAKKDESLRKGEIRATLDPSQFADARVRKAYQIAKDIPWVLDSIYCYCLCKESPAFRHKSLLSCYVDNHAAV
jgi:hypothetical protein